MFTGCLNVLLIAWYEYVSIRLHEGMILFYDDCINTYVLRQLIYTWVQVGVSFSIRTDNCELIVDYDMTDSLDKGWFKLIDTMSWSLE